MATRQQPTPKPTNPTPPPAAPNGNGQSNRTPVLTVYNDGTMIVAPELTQGDALQIAEMIRRAVLSQPLVSRQTQAPMPEPDMLSGNPYKDRHLP